MELTVSDIDPGLPSRKEAAMKPPLSRWKYDEGFLTVVHRGKNHELGYFVSHEDAHNAAVAFFEEHGGQPMKSATIRCG
jgi:hypothetical protein